MIRLLAASEVDGHDKASTFVRDYALQTSSSLINNVTTHLWLLDTGSHQFPVSENNGNEHCGHSSTTHNNAKTQQKTKPAFINSYVVSPKTAFVDYAKEEIIRLHKRWLYIGLIPLVKLCGSLLHITKIDKLVQVNNWLLSTNIYPSDWRGEDIPDITTMLVNQFPAHAIAFRSLNEMMNNELLVQFQRAGYIPIPTRQVYLFDGRDNTEQSFSHRHNYQLDQKLIINSDYDIEYGDTAGKKNVMPSTSAQDDFERIEALYNFLYLDKYSHLNPQYSSDWLRKGHQHQWLTFCVLRRKENNRDSQRPSSIDGVVAWFEDDDVITAPIVGYDTHLPQSLGLYRQLTWLCLNRAAKQKKWLNFSSGAAHFKQLRGGKPAIEFTMVYVNHLPFYRRAVWYLLSVLLRNIAIPILRKYKL